jgi:hypothetical protein
VIYLYLDRFRLWARGESRSASHVAPRIPEPELT